MLELSENLKKRIISALVIIPPVLLVILIGGWLLYVSLICIAILMSFEWANITQNNEKVQLSELSKRKWLFAGLAYVGIPIASVLSLLQEPSGIFLLLWLVAVVIATDTLAFFVGRSIGGPKLAPKISPNKTWSGLVGGVLAAGIVGLLFGVVMSQASVSQMIMISIFLALVSQIGDLMESGIKRYFGVKDSGFIIPGHGGVLDRLDGYVTAIPVGLLLHWLLGGLF